MSDQPPGPGWWLASDGRWYPPELHPDASKESAPSAWATPGESETAAGWAAPSAPAPTPAAPPTPPWSLPPPTPAPAKRSPWLLAVAIVIALIVVGAVAALVTRSSGKSSSSTSSTRGGVAASGTTPAGPTVRNSNGDVSLTLPTGWVGADVENGSSGVGAQLFPDDPDRASAIEQRLSLLPRATVLFGADASQLTGGFTSNVNVATDPTAPTSLSLDDLGRAEANGTTRFGATVVDRGTIDLNGHETYRFTYTGTGFAGIAFVLKGRDSVWIAIYTFGSLSDTNQAIADGSAATLIVP